MPDERNLDRREVGALTISGLRATLPAPELGEIVRSMDQPEDVDRLLVGLVDQAEAAHQQLPNAGVVELGDDAAPLGELIERSRSTLLVEPPGHPLFDLIMGNDAPRLYVPRPRLI